MKEGKLTYDYDSNGTDVDWNSQETVKDKGKIVFLDVEGNHWTEDDITVVKGTCEDCVYCHGTTHAGCPCSEPIEINGKIISCGNWTDEDSEACNAR